MLSRWLLSRWCENLLLGVRVAALRMTAIKVTHELSVARRSPPQFTGRCTAVRALLEPLRARQRCQEQG